MSSRFSRSILHRQIRHYNPHRPTAASISAKTPPPIASIHKALSEIGVPGQLPDAIALQTVTHKSWNHGAEGYNEKLAFCGRRILEHRISHHLVRQSLYTSTTTAPTASYTDAANATGDQSADGIADNTAASITKDTGDAASSASKTSDQINDQNGQGELNFSSFNVVKGKLVPDLIVTRVTALAYSMKPLLSTMRWRPRNTSNVEISGVARVAGETLCAVVGVVDLRFGTEAAQEFVDGKIIPRLNLDNPRDKQ